MRSCGAVGSFMKKIDLVFRHIDERTAKVALDFALEHIRPDAVHVFEEVRPFTECVNQMLRIDHDCDYVVYLDADCLILEDMRPFLDRCDVPYVDSYVSDRFRGRLHCGAHITRRDVVDRMASIIPPEDDMAYVLRPESRLRNLALTDMGLSKQFRNFDILHDHFQFNRHIFMKYAVRELRSRTDMQFQRLAMAMETWPAPAGEVDDFVVARHAVRYARELVPVRASPAQVHHFIETLPQRAESELARLGIEEKGEFTHDDLENWRARHAGRPAYGAAVKKPKVFGIGLSRTGTRSLTQGLQILGFDSIHYPGDAETYRELSSGSTDLTVMKNYDALTDITTVPYYQQLDKTYPGSKFILTIRDKESWLQSCANHWHNRPAFKEPENPQEETYLRMRQLLRAAIFGCYDFVPERFAWVYDRHTREVLDYFKDRPDDLLVIDIANGEGFEKLAPFLGKPLPAEPFPHKGGVLSARMAQQRAAAAGAAR
jgi:hypothetical protein